MSQDLKRAKTKRLTKEAWAEIEAIWESGGMTLDDLASKYGCDRGTYFRHFKKHGIVQGIATKATKNKIADNLQAIAATEASVIAMRINETKEQHYNLSAAVAQLAWAEIVNAKTAGVPIGAAINNLKALDVTMSALKKAREERYSVLGLDRADAIDPSELPELIVAELTTDKIQVMRDAASLAH